nr:hypothetical protein [uncultured Butyrivibrio sp.]
MTYKLNHELGKIVSPIELLFPDGSSREYANGAEALAEEFDERYVISSISAKENKIVISLEAATVPSIDFDGDEVLMFE